MEYVYCMTTILDGLVKIGKTKNFKRRMGLLEANGYRNITGLQRYFAVTVDEGVNAENHLKEMFKHCQVGNTELLSADINDVVIKMLELGKEYYSKLGDENTTIELARDNKGLYNVPEGNYNYVDKTNKRIATIYIDDEHKILLCKNSIIANVPTKSFRERGFKAYQEWERAQQEFSKNSVLFKDFECSSLSLAASIVSGAYKDGWKFWKNNKGEYINRYRKSAFVLEDD